MLDEKLISLVIQLITDYYRWRSRDAVEANMGGNRRLCRGSDITESVMELISEFKSRQGLYYPFYFMFLENVTSYIDKNKIKKRTLKSVLKSSDIKNAYNKVVCEHEIEQVMET